MGSMLTAINDFVQDSLRAAGELGSIDYGDNRILIERGQQAVLAAVEHPACVMVAELWNSLISHQQEPVEEPG